MKELQDQIEDLKQKLDQQSSIIDQLMIKTIKKKPPSHQLKNQQYADLLRQQVEARRQSLAANNQGSIECLPQKCPQPGLRPKTDLYRCESALSQIGSTSLQNKSGSIRTHPMLQRNASLSALFMGSKQQQKVKGSRQSINEESQKIKFMKEQQKIIVKIENQEIKNRRGKHAQSQSFVEPTEQYKENLHPNIITKPNDPIDLIKANFSQLFLDDYSDHQSCEVDDEDDVIVNERKEVSTLNHHLIRQSGILPTKLMLTTASRDECNGFSKSFLQQNPPINLVASSPERKNPIKLNDTSDQDDDDDIVQLSKTQNVRRLPNASQIQLVIKKPRILLNNQSFCQERFERQHQEVGEKKKEGTQSENVESDDDSPHTKSKFEQPPLSDEVEISHSRRESDIGGRLSKMVLQRKGLKLMNSQLAENARNQPIDLFQFKTQQDLKDQRIKPAKLIIKQAKVDLQNNHKRRLTDLHEARLRIRSQSRQSIELNAMINIDAGLIENIKTDNYNSLSNSQQVQNNEQGSQKLSHYGSKRALKHLDMPLSKSISSLDQTLKAVKDLLDSKKNRSQSNNMIKLKLKGSQNIQQNPYNESTCHRLSGTTILYKEHMRKSLKTSKSEGLIPTLNQQGEIYINDINYGEPMEKIANKAQSIILKEKRLQRQGSVAMIDNRLNLSSSINQASNENLQEFFQIYESFKNKNSEIINHEIPITEVQYRPMKRSQKLMLLRLKAGTQQQRNIELIRSFDQDIC